MRLNITILVLLFLSTFSITFSDGSREHLFVCFLHLFLQEVVWRRLVFGIKRSLASFDGRSLSIHGCGIRFAVIAALRITGLILGDELVDAVIGAILFACMCLNISILVLLLLGTLGITFSDGSREHLF